MSALSADIRNARLPASYDHAKQALAACERIDECQEWADKAAALASYAKQADDDEMLKMATRIKGRAIRRAGELLKQIEAKHGARTDIQPSAGAHTRSEVANAAGMSKHQAVQAVRVASIPREDFDAQVESDAPPTITALALQGIKPRVIDHREGRSTEDFQRAKRFVADVQHAAKTLTDLDAGSALAVLLPNERDLVRVAISKIDAFTDRIATRL